MSRVFEHVEEAHLRNHWVRATVNSVLDAASAYVKGENLVYFTAALGLAANDPEGFWRNALDFGAVRFHGHVRKGKKLVSCKAHWADEEKRRANA